MVKVRGILSATFAAGWLGGYTFKLKGVNPNPYPIGILPFIRVPYRMPLFGLRPYPPAISQYYSPTGWIYQRQRTWHGVILIARRGAKPREPATSRQVATWQRFKEAMDIWKSMDKQLKDIYNKMKYPYRMLGHNRFIRLYIKDNPPMAVYWGNLQRSADNSDRIEEVFVQKNIPIINYSLNFYNNQAFNMVIHKGNGYPDSPVEGQIFYREDNKKIYKYDGSQWDEVAEISDINDKKVATLVVAQDGTGDYTDIQTAINNLPSEGGLIYIKQGTYNITSTIEIAKSNVIIRGHGNATTLHMPSSVSVDLFKIGNGSNSYENIRIENLNLSGPYPMGYSGSGVYITNNCSKITIKNCEFNNWPEYGIEISGYQSDLYFINNVFNNCQSQAIFLAANNKVLIQGNKFIDNYQFLGEQLRISDSQDIQINNNQFIYTSTVYDGYHIRLVGNNVTTENIIITNNHFYQGATAIETQILQGKVSRCIISKNTFKGMTSNGINMTESNNSIEGCEFYNINGNAIVISGTKNIVINCRIITANKNGIYISNNENIVKGTIIDIIKLNGIIIDNASNNIIEGNIIGQVSSQQNGLYSAIYIKGASWRRSKYNNIINNQLFGPSYTPRKGYSIFEYTAYVDYSNIGINRCKNAVRTEIQKLGVNSKLFYNTTV